MKVQEGARKELAFDVFEQEEYYLGSKWQAPTPPPQPQALLQSLSTIHNHTLTWRTPFRWCDYLKSYLCASGLS